MEVASATDNAAWNCEQGKNGEWVCLNQGQPSQEAAQPKVIGSQKAPQAGQPAASAELPAATATMTRTVPDAPAATPQRAEQTATENPVASAEAPAPTPRASLTESQMPAPGKKAVAATNKPGWTCQSGEVGKTNWNCNLVGADPKGAAQVAAAAEAETTSNLPWLTPAYDRQQERTFELLRGEFAQDPWQNCSNWSARRRKIKGASSEAREEANTDVLADFSEVFDGEILNFAGNVDLNRADQHLSADKASYDTVADTMDAQGNVVYSESTLALAADTVSISLARNEARIRNAQFIEAAAPLRGSAAVMYRDSKSLSRYNEATFTSCPPGNQDWVMHASRVKINRESGQGSAKNAWLEFKGVPVIYTPYISFPVDNRRTSGLLAPTWSNTERNGFDFAAPFYWNIATNYDTVITPRYMQKRGGMLRNKFRYLTETSSGSLAAEIMPYDQLREKSRYSAAFRDNSRFTDNLNLLTNLNYVSDKEYFNDMNNALGFQTNRFLSSTSYLNYGRPGIAFSAGVNHYQSVDKTITDAGMPYDILPRVNLSLEHSFDNMPLALGMNNQYSHFYHSELVNGQRLNLAPSVSFPLESSAGFFIPKITGQYTQYQLSNQTAANQPDSISRFLPIFSADTGMTFEKQLNIGNTAYTHTLEPRLFYLYIPRKDQSDIPVFDTAAFDTNFYSLFRENRFSGLDRIQDANQITLAGSSRFIDSSSGLEPLKISLGQILYFQDRTVNLPGVPNQTSSTSNFIGELSGQVTNHLSYTAGAQWDPEANGFARGLAVLKFRNQPDQIFDVGYRYRRNTPNDQLAFINPSNNLVTQTAVGQTISQSDVSFRWPLAAGWYGLGRWQYSFNFGKTTESFIGIEKENCCWRLRVIGRRYINGATTTNFLAPDAKPENAVFVQLELKGLTGFGDQVDRFLQRNLNGYRPASDFED
ncbi:LPS assembly protein LptD [Methylomonas sp. SURF-2]|uniref:LPS-assembly protein LptD n=1 Tax=Methylomonas subterranea TaxID=2952225 RepID=A0ABT1TLM7_9GAMM|nr:LPS assembly protein LptD [Methylomonas sp. SURF-2]MCQ8106340.1 LPS assembly protein LptD [Methylomonas sp. SURF-2]